MGQSNKMKQVYIPGYGLANPGDVANIKKSQAVNASGNSSQEEAASRAQMKKAQQGIAARSERAYDDLMKRMQGQDALAAALPGKYEEAQKSVGEAFKTGKARAKQQAARGLQAAASGGGFGSGSKMAQLRQTAQDVGMGQADLEARSGMEQSRMGLDALGAQMAANQALFGMSQQAGQAGVDARGQQFESMKTIAGIGTEAQASQAKIANYDTKINKIIGKHKNWMNDDEDAMYSEIMNLAAGETDPQVKAYLQQQANDIKTKVWDV